MQAPRNCNHQAGFTLLELVLALSISVIISAGAYQILASTSDAILHVSNRRPGIQALQELQWSLRRDVHSIVTPIAHHNPPALSRIQLHSDSTAGLRIAGPGATSFLRFSLTGTHYSTEPSGSSTHQIYRSPSEAESGAIDRDDHRGFDRITVVKTVIEDAPGNYHLNWPDASGNRNAENPGARYRKRRLPRALNMTVYVENLGHIMFEVSI